MIAPSDAPPELLCAVLERAIEEDGGRGAEGVWAHWFGRGFGWTGQRAGGVLRKMASQGLAVRLGKDRYGAMRWTLTPDGEALAAQWGEAFPCVTCFAADALDGEYQCGPCLLPELEGRAEFAEECAAGEVEWAERYARYAQEHAAQAADWTAKAATYRELAVRLERG